MAPRAARGSIPVVFKPPGSWFFITAAPGHPYSSVPEVSPFRGQGCVLRRKTKSPKSGKRMPFVVLLSRCRPCHLSTLLLPVSPIEGRCPSGDRVAPLRAQGSSQLLLFWAAFPSQPHLGGCEDTFLFLLWFSCLRLPAVKQTQQASVRTFGRFGRHAFSIPGRGGQQAMRLERTGATGSCDILEGSQASHSEVQL